MRSALIPTTSTRAQNPAVAAQRTKEILRYPACVHCPEPSLTLKACSLHVRGIVALEATISERGRVEQIAVLKALDYGLTERAIKAVGRWRISPAIGIDEGISDQHHGNVWLRQPNRRDRYRVRLPAMRTAPSKTGARSPGFLDTHSASRQQIRPVPATCEFRRGSGRLPRRNRCDCRG